MSTSISCLPAVTSACLKGCFYICPSQGVFLHLPFSKGVFTAVCLKGCFYICPPQGVILHLSVSRGVFTSVSRGVFHICLKGCFYICLPQGARGCPTALGQAVCDGTFPTVGQSSQATHLMTLSVWLCASGLVLMDWLADARSCRLFCRSMEPF